jgi:GT2 family glycosyltransferase
VTVTPTRFSGAPRHDFPDDVDVAVVTHNNLEQLPAALDSIAAAGCPADRVAVVDVASTDGTLSWLATQWPSITVRRILRNDGPSPGRNVGITQATRRFILLMDADVIVAPDAVQRLHAAMCAEPQVKVGSPIVVHISRPDTIQYAGGALHFICEAVNPWLDRPLADRGSAPVNISAAPTCALLLERDAAIEVGLFDERYFIGKEDGDFSHRIVMAGYYIRELADALAYHRSRPRGTWLFYYQIRNRWHFILKNYEWRTIVAIIPALLVHEPLQLAVLAMKGHLVTYVKAACGLLAMLPTLRRDRALANRIRKVHDRDLLVSGPLIVRDDLAGHAFVRRGKHLYERALTWYWRLITGTILA